MIDCLIVAHFCDGALENSNNRFNYIANLLSQNKINVELITSNYSHINKRYRSVTSSDSINTLKYKLTYINEPQYSKNVSLKRFYSHYMMSKNLERHLNKRKTPDIIYCAVPSLDIAYTTMKYAKRNNIPFIVDVQDLWPEAFKMVVGLPVISNLLFYPMKKKADMIYRGADKVVAVSQTYVERVLNINSKCSNGLSVFLGTDLNSFDKYAKKNIVNKPKNKIWLVYIGTLGHSYDIRCVIDALAIIGSKGINNIKFIVMGDGPLRNEFEGYSEQKNICVEFKGKLKYDEMVGLLASCDIAINTIAKGASGSIINKVGDYAAAGLPVLNTQECNEYRALVEDYQVGLNCNNGDANDLAKKLMILYNSDTMRKKMGKNNRRLAEEKFDRGTTYKNILSLIQEL